MLTKEYLDDYPGGWVDYAPLRIAQLEIKRCMNKTLCEENLNILLPVVKEINCSSSNKLK
ncbi:Sialyltransferase-like protein 1, partial [Mucuna pruriens]